MKKLHSLVAVFASEAPVPKVRARLRPRKAKMDAFAKRVSTVPRFALETAAAAVSAAMAKAKVKA